MLQTQNLSFSYPNEKKITFPDLACHPNETLLILGDSGSGKSTLLHLLALLINPSTGQIIINKQNTAHLKGKAKVDFRAKNIGIIYQKPYFVNSLNVTDNLLIANYLANNTQNYQKALQLANQLGFENLFKKKVQDLSGGEQQRVCIGRALMNEPKLILADEPTSALDDTNCEKVIQLLTTQAQLAKAALIIVTHDYRLKSRFTKQIQL
jgi:ABC-type lipoprotein export system ATPase subunit